MTIYEKIQLVKQDVLQANPKKSGLNKFSGYDYYELSDFLPIIIKSCVERKLMTFVSFTDELATLTVVNAEKPDEVVTITSPMRDLEIKGANAVQALGGVETYQRRYLYMALFDITENDMFDSTNTDRNPATVKKPAKKQGAKPIACEQCGTVIEGYGKMNAEEMAHYTAQKYGRCLCSACATAESKKG